MSELMTCDAEGALGEREDLGGRDREHEDRPTTFEVKAAAARPSSVPFGGFCITPRNGALGFTQASPSSTNDRMG